MSARPAIFIGGLMRSGTTLLRAMLEQHSTIASGLETHWFEINWKTGTARRGEPLVPYLHRIGEFFGLDAGFVDSARARADSAEAFLDLFMAEAARRAGKPRWAEKTTGNILHLDRILAHWPDARIIHIIRDPKDVFASFRRSGKYGAPADYGELWADFFAAAERFRQTLPLDKDNYLELRYEALVTAPAAQMRRVIEYLDEPWEPAVAEFAGRPGEHDQVLSLTGHSSTTLAQLAQPMTSDRIGQWQDTLSAADVETARAAVDRRGLASLFRAIEEESRRIAQADTAGPA